MFISQFVIIFLEILNGNLWQFLDILLGDLSFVFMIFVFIDEEFDLIGSLFASSIHQLLPNWKEERFKTVINYDCVLLGINAVL